tara:strand:- start:19 stop:120 length:102 start_codon:yes stop_codon:yes gene_type:complete
MLRLPDDLLLPQSKKYATSVAATGGLSVAYLAD